MTLLLTAFRIVAFLSIATPIMCQSDQDATVLTTRAIDFLVTKTFVQYFTEFTLPTDGDIVSGSQLYSKIKDPNFNELGKSSMVNRIAVDEIKKIVRIWTTTNLISSEAATNLGNILAKENFKTIVEMVYVRDNGELIYGTIGFVEMTKSDGNRMGTVLSSFRKLKLQEPAVVTFDTSSIDTDTCSLWGEYCPILFKIDGFSDDDNRRLFSYIRSETIKVFVEESEPYIKYINRETMRYQVFLPNTFAEASKKMEENPSTLPTELFAEDPFVSNL